MSGPLVVDCSAVVNALVVHDDDDETFGLMTGHELHAPNLIDYEFVSALRLLCFTSALAPNIAREALELWLALDVHRHPADAVIRRTWELRDELSAYDAAYVALAEAMDAPLLTADKRMAHAASRYCEVIG